MNVKNNPRRKSSFKSRKNKVSHKQLLLHVTEVDWQYETTRIIDRLRTTGAQIAYIDLFCGAGGTTNGVEQAHYNGRKIASVILGINHDRKAIESHLANHPHTLHLVEDVRDVNLAPIALLVERIREYLPGIKIALWASAECTNHSIAKGGATRDADSRSLPEELCRYIRALRPDLIQIENVKEFQIWGPLIHKNICHTYNKALQTYEKTEEINVTEYQYRIRHKEYGTLYSMNNKKWYSKRGLAYSKEGAKGIVPWMVPDKRYLGQYFNEWVQHIQALGYPNYEHRVLDCADVGAVTTRKRYFGQFTFDMPIAWPVPTHAKDPEKMASIYGKLKPHRPVKEVLDFSDKGTSIFIPGRITSNMSFRRFLQGCIKFIAGGKEKYSERKRKFENFSFIQNYQVTITYTDHILLVF